MISTELIKITYTGNGKNTAFPFTFPFNDGDDIKCAIRDLATDAQEILTKDYYVDTNASVVYYPGYAPGEEPAESEQPAILDKNHTITVYRETPHNQLEDLGDKYPLPTVEGMNDKLTMIIQELQEVIDRCVKLNISSQEDVSEYLTLVQNAAAAAANAAAAALKSQESAEDSAEEAVETVETGKVALNKIVADGSTSLTGIISTGATSLNKTVSDGVIALDGTTTSGVTTINTTRDAAVNTVNDAKTAALTEINPKVQEAANSASAAAKSASAAATSEANAGKSESNAKASETNAATSEANAKTSETNAGKSETNAKTSETNAGKSETNAAASESAAAGSASSAAGSATAAATSATNAKTSETNSATSEKKAGEYAEKAESYYDITYHVKGDVSTYAELPTNPENGDVYKIITADSGHGVRAGDKVAWVTSSNSWENFAGSVDLSGYVPIAEESSITFSLGYDENGVFMVTPD